MKSFDNFLTEKHQSILYRYTGIRSGSSALHSLKMQTVDRKQVKNDTDANHGPEGYGYFISTSRSAQSSYYTEEVVPSFVYPILFELDGRVLSRKYKIQPFNFSYLAHGEFGASRTGWQHDRSTDEEEDRVYSKTPRIDLTGAIRACYLHSDEGAGLSEWEDDDTISAWESVINTCKEKKIPLWHVPTIPTPLRDRIKKGERLV